MVSGSIREVSLAGRIFPVTADSDPGRQLGGFTNEIQANGDGSVRVVQTRMPWSVSGLTLVINNGRQDQEYIQNLIDSGSLFVFSITYADSVTYSGSAQVVGEFDRASMAGTAEVGFMGSQKLTQQS